MNELLIKWPTRSRPKLFLERLRLYQQDPAARFLVTIDEDDGSMVNATMLGFLAAQPRMTFRIGQSKSKVEAVNDGLAEMDWQGVACVASDDMVPQRSDYASRILSLFGEHFPNGDGVLHLSDGRNGKILNTLPIFDRAYFLRDKYAYCPAYESVFVDNEFQEVSERRGRAVFVDECVIRHDWIGEHPDALHVRNEGCWASDEKIFRARQSAGFP